MSFVDAKSPTTAAQSNDCNPVRSAWKTAIKRGSVPAEWRIAIQLPRGTQRVESRHS